MRTKTTTLSFAFMLSVSIIVILGLVYNANKEKFAGEKNFSFETSLPKKRVSKTVRYHTQPIIDAKDKTMVSLGDFTTNMSFDDSSSRFVRARVGVKTDSVDTSEEILAKNILIRDSVIDTMSHNRFSDIGFPRGKERLKNEIRNNINVILGEGEVQEVYFTEFIMQ